MSETKLPLALPTFQTIPWTMITFDPEKDLIGQGGYGAVYRGTWQNTIVAVKQLYLKTFSSELVKNFEQEALIMTRCQFPHIVRLYGVCMESNHYALVMEYMSKGSLYDVLHNPTKVLPWNVLCWDIAIDMGKGLTYLHDQNIIHCDLKSLNVLLDENYHTKISDFGLSAIKLETSRTTSTSTKKKQSGVGTTRWRAPELFTKPKIKATLPNKASDVYGYGMVLWEIASRELPFKDAPDETMAGISIAMGAKEDIPTNCPAEYATIILSCWEDVPAQRPTANQVLDALIKAKPICPPQSWHFDTQTHLPTVSENKPYELVLATKADHQKVIEYYQHHPVPGYDIQSVEVIYHPGMNRKFALYLAELQQRYNNPAFQARWSAEEADPDKKEWRGQVANLLETLAKPFVDTNYPAIKLVPMWHGTRTEVTDSIFKAGYANLATTDSGFFGKGIYGTYEAEYAYRVYSKMNGALIMNWMACFSAYPVIDGDMQKLETKGNYGNYDAHFAPVVPASSSPNETIYYPTKLGQVHQYAELVVFQSAACLPRYLVTLQPTLVVGPIVDPKKIEKEIEIKLPVPSGEQACRAGRQYLAQNQYDKAYSAFEESAQQGYPPAYLALGFLLSCEGTGFKNDLRSQKYYTEAANNLAWFRERDHQRDIQTYLGFCYYHGIGKLSQDFKQAVAYYQKAADQGDLTAQFNLGVCYEEGKKGVMPSNLEQALYYYQKAADQGNATAQYLVGQFYDGSKGLSRNLEKAIWYYQLAVSQEHQGAKDKLAEILSQQGYSKLSAQSTLFTSPETSKRKSSVTIPIQESTQKPTVSVCSIQ